MGIRKRERQKFIADVMRQISVGALSVRWEMWQKCPNTAVRVFYHPASSDKVLIGIGFSKVSWPDVWNEEEGQRIALQKAIASIWRQVMNAPLVDNQ